MKQIEIKNIELKQILNNFLNVLQKEFNVETFNFDKPAEYDKPGNLFTVDYATGDAYLAHMQGKKVTGYPEEKFGFDFLNGLKALKHIPILQNGLNTLDRDLLAWSGSRNNAVKVFYPKGGFMGWHHNANAPGYNILLSWSKNGTGFFRYQDPITKNIVTMRDAPGWVCKVGYYGKWEEKDKIYWHCAGAPHEERFTLGYIIPHIGLWESMIEDIESE